MPEGTDKVHVKYLPEKAEMDTGVNNQITITYNSRPYIFEVKTITTTGKGWGGGITSEARKTLEEKVNARLKNDDNGNLPQL
jgi:hypothetical protein